ncbi:21546_t:CDS:2, partial [Gigaspora rosea]
MIFEEFGENFAKAINYPKLDVNLVEWLANQLSGGPYTHKLFWQKVLS